MEKERDMRVRLLCATVVNGGVWEAGSVVDVDEAEAASLLRDGLVAVETPPLTPPHRSTDGEEKKNNGK